MLKSYIIYRKAAFFQMLSILLIALFLLSLSAWVIKSRGLTMLFLALIVAPFLFINTLLKRYTRKVLITLNSDSFSIVIKKMTDDEQGNLFNYELKNIISYKIQFPNRKFASLVFNLRSNRAVEYSFSQNKIDSEQADTNVLIESFHALISNYNSSQPENEKIEFLPSFYASKGGLYSIAGLVVLFSLAIVIHILYNIKTLPISLFIGLAMIVQIVLKRKADIAFYEKMK